VLKKKKKKKKKKTLLNVYRHLFSHTSSQNISYFGSLVPKLVGRWEDDIKMDPQKVVWGHGPDLSGSGQGQVTGFCNCG